MGKRRTRKQKIKARQRFEYSLPEVTQKAEVKDLEEVKEKKVEVEKAVEPTADEEKQRKLIIGDLKRSGIIFTLMVVLLALAWFFLR